MKFLGKYMHLIVSCAKTCFGENNSQNLLLNMVAHEIGRGVQVLCCVDSEQIFVVRKGHKQVF